MYLICEPPGEPYYLGRIMEFLPAKDNPSGRVDTIRINWYYRPKDIQRRVPDSRLVFASMHSDTCPLSSLRGKCTISHISEIENLDEFRKQRDTFWYDKLFDRYMHRYYEVVPTKDVINVPANVKKVLDERWKFILCEPARRKELTGAVKTCKRCGLYAASADSVDCAVCHSTYHMGCVRPVLTKKPARGFAWACAACSRAQERKLEARNTPIIGDAAQAAEEADDELAEEEEEEEEPSSQVVPTGRSSPAGEEKFPEPRPATAAQIAQAKMWPYRYFGIHCQLEDALDYDDRIYPRASSRLGTRHQAVVSPWYGRPVQYVKPVYIKKKSKSKMSKEAQAAAEAERQARLARPKWIVDEPRGYIRRGEDEPVLVNGKEVRTSQLLFKMPEPNQIPSSGRGEDDAPGSDMSPEDREKFIDDYMERAKKLAPEKGLETYSTNFLDKALEYLYAENFNVEAALARLKRADKYKDLREPKLTAEQVKLFEEGVAKYGSELASVRRHIGNIEHRHVVRFYYMWKKTKRGREIWGNYEGRRGKKESKRADSSKLADDLADDQDDSAFDTEKATEKKRGFQCKFCFTRSSPHWRRAPNTVPGATTRVDAKKGDKGTIVHVALCHRCAILWRKYAIEYKDAEELAKKLANSGNKSWRRKLDEELYAQMLAAEESAQEVDEKAIATATSLGLSSAAHFAESHSQSQGEPAKKKARTAPDKESAATSARTSAEPAPPTKKKAAAEKPAEPPPIVPEPPRARPLPCAVCTNYEPFADELVSCRDCRLTVHRRCYGVRSDEVCTKWMCDMCDNDRDPMVSTRYECVLCPVTYTEHELMEPPRPSNNKKKTDRDREKERLEKEMVAEAIKLYRQRQEAAGKPTGPREPLKRTAGNNWVHVTCALWNPEIKFGNAKELEPAEGFGLIPAERYAEICKLCKTNKGACVSCHHPGCNVKFHVGCAFQAGYVFGFDVTPVKSSRRDSITTLKMGDESGLVTPCIWCPNHPIQTIVHKINEPAGKDGRTALQLYAETYKQADLTLTGTVRKAAHVQQSAGSVMHGGHHDRRASAVNGASAKQGSDNDAEKSQTGVPAVGSAPSKFCVRCHTTFSPKWWPAEEPARSATVGVNGSGGPSGNTVGVAGSLKCHKCHVRKNQPPTSTDSRPPFPGTRASILSAPRGPEYGPSFGTHAPPPPPNVLGRPDPGWYSSYEMPHRPGEYADSYRHGLPASQPNGYKPAGPYAGSPPPPMNGYSAAPLHHNPPGAPPHPLPPPPHYTSGPPGAAPPPPPPPHSFGGPPVTYGAPVAAHSSHPSPAPPYPAPISRPEVPTNMARPSPPHSLAGSAPPRPYPVERIVSTQSQSSPSKTGSSVEPGMSSDEGGTTTHSSGRHTSTNGTNTGSGASASPSLKNLLS